MRLITDALDDGAKAAQANNNSTYAKLCCLLSTEILACLQRMRLFCFPESAIIYKHSSTALCPIIMNFIECLATSQSLADTTTMHIEHCTTDAFQSECIHVTGRKP